MPTFSRSLEETLHRALALANERKHEFATLEHLLLALISDRDASATMKACNVDLEILSRALIDYLDKELENLAATDGVDAKPTPGFQRVIQRAVIHVQSSGRDEVSGANVLIGIFAEHESHAVHFLLEQDMTRYDAVNYLSHGIAKRPSPPVPLRGMGQLAEQRLTVLSAEEDSELETWLCDVLAGAGFDVNLFRESIRAGLHIPTALSDEAQDSIFVALITPAFLKGPTYKIIKKKAVFETLTRNTSVIPLVIGPAIEVSPFGEIAQVLLSKHTAQEVHDQLSEALDTMEPYEIFADRLAAALTNYSRQHNGNTKVVSRNKSGEKALESQFEASEPSTEPGPEFDITQAGLALREPRPIDPATDYGTQRRLYDELNRIAPALAQLSGRSNSPGHQGLAAITAEYAELIAQPFESLDVVSLWIVGAGLLANRDSFARAIDNRTMTEPLEPPHMALLQQASEIHGGFILGFSEARELSRRADEARVSGESMERVVNLARSIIHQLRISYKEVDRRTRQLLAAVEEGLVEPGWRVTRAGYAAYVVTRNALIAIGKLVGWANSAMATVGGGLVLNQMDPGLIHTQFWIEFVLKNSQQILAFSEPFPELKVWLNAQIEAARSDKEAKQ